MPNSHIRELTDEQNVALHVMERAFDSGGELGGIVNLTGPYGSGKTALAHILRQQLQQSDVQVFALMMEPDAAELGSTLSRIVANASPQPLVVMIDEWDRLLTRTPSVKALAVLQRVLRDLVWRGPKNGVVLISCLMDVKEWRKTLPEALLARMVTARLSTVLRGKARESESHPIGTLPPDRLLKSEEVFAQLRQHFELSSAAGGFDNVDRLLNDSHARTLVAIHLVSLATGRQRPGFDSVARLLARARLLERHEKTFVMAGWLREILDDAGVGQTGHEPDFDYVVDRLTTALEAFAWERFLRALMSTRTWLESEISALGIDVPMSDGALPTLVTRLGQKPAEFVAALFRPSDLKDLMQPGETLPKEEVLENAFRRWRESVR